MITGNSDSSRLLFYVEMIKMNREEARSLGILWVYILLGVGVTALTNISATLTSTGLVGINLCLLAFAFFYVISIRRCYKGILEASKGIQREKLLTEQELRGYALLPSQLKRLSFLLAYIPVLAMVTVVLIIMLR